MLRYRLSHPCAVPVTDLVFIYHHILYLRGRYL